MENHTEYRFTEVEKLAMDWATAELHGDAVFLGETLADDFIAIGPRGFMLTKEQWIERHATGKLTYKSMDLDEISIRAYGDAAVLTARQMSEAIYQDDERRHELNDDFRITIIFATTGDGVSIVGLQISPIAGPPS